MKQYLNLLDKVLSTENYTKDRTGVGTIHSFGETLRFDLSHSFPLVTTKKMFWKGIVHELLWMLSGSSSIEYLQKNNVHIWDAWADEDSYVGPLYGTQWRDWLGYDSEGNVFGIDQLKNAIDLIRKTPYSRRIIVNAWNVSELKLMALPPCHMMYQFLVDITKKTLSCCVYMRSADLFLGVPFDIASYALLTNMVAHITGYKPGELIMFLGDAHIYTNHIEQVQEQCQRLPLILPTLRLNDKITDIDDFKFEDIELLNYSYHPAIHGDLAI